MAETIQCIRQQISRDHAERIVADIIGQATRVEKTLYYPYLGYSMHYHLKTAFGTQRLGIECLVDGRRNIASTSDSYETIDAEPMPGEILESRVTAMGAENTARRTMTHVAMTKHRALVPLQIEITSGRLLYKMFWIVGSSADGVRVLIDSTTGHYVPLAGETEPAAA